MNWISRRNMSGGFILLLLFHTELHICPKPEHKTGNNNREGSLGHHGFQGST